jgi:hypothetical protein
LMISNNAILSKEVRDQKKLVIDEVQNHLKKGPSTPDLASKKKIETSVGRGGKSFTNGEETKTSKNNNNGKK